MRRHSSGQSLVETLVALAALVALLMSMVWLARVLDHQQLALMAVRESAFECVWLPSGCRAGAAALPGSLQIPAHPRQLPWGDPVGRPGVQTLPPMEVSRELMRFDTPLAFAGGSAARAIPGAVSLLSELAGPGRFGLDLEAGLVRSTVVVRWASAEPLTSGALGALGASGAWGATLGAWRHEARLALLTDDWMARGPEGESPDTVRSRVERGQQVPGLEPLIRAGWWPVRGLLQIAAWLGLESSAQHFTPGQIDVDLLPPDRRGLGPLPGLETAPEPIPWPDPGSGSSDGA